MERQRNDATASAQGLVLQFWVALDACFRMHPGDKVYIEKFGDVTTFSENGNVQTEVKKRLRPLSDGSEEIWNTIYNWFLGCAIPATQYSSLVLYTTQKISSNSHWGKWNESSHADKQDLLSHLTQCLRTKRSKRYKDLAELLEKKDVKNQLVNKLLIVSASSSKTDWEERLSTYTSGVPRSRKRDFLNQMLGNIVSMGDGKTEWVVEYNVFNQIAEDAAAKLSETTTEFPDVVTPDAVENCGEMLFVSKLREIEYDKPDVVNDAVEEYLFAMSYCAKFSDNRYRINQVDQYSDGIHRAYRTSFRRAKLDFQNGDVINASQQFYESFRERPVEPLGKYNNTPQIFRNGIAQRLAEDDKISWHLTKNNNNK